MYSKIMRQICESRPWGKKVAFRSLKWLLCQEVQLPMAEFLEAISIDTNAEGTTIEVSKTDVLYICYNFVVHDKSTQHTAHLSVREYLKSQADFFFSPWHSLMQRSYVLLFVSRQILGPWLPPRWWRVYLVVRVNLG